MSLSTLLNELFSRSDSTDSPDATAESSDDVPSITVVHECRNCGTNVSAGTTQCPACGNDDIVTYSIE